MKESQARSSNLLQKYQINKNSQYQSSIWSPPTSIFNLIVFSLLATSSPSSSYQSWEWVPASCAKRQSPAVARLEIEKLLENHRTSPKQGTVLHQEDNNLYTLLSVGTPLFKPKARLSQQENTSNLRTQQHFSEHLETWAFPTHADQEICNLYSTTTMQKLRALTPCTGQHGPVAVPDPHG